ncbi:GPP34 family phosphoprotein [Streptomyces sp. NPDC048639]|uniref:GOLPH3/VPS74 family protein n=1 Tax=Streptomyces sp. NPDC048639 TaxID=3365581 RepID=UPI0037210C05
MTTSRDLMITAMDVTPSRTVERGRLSLALAGAELIDLLAAETVTLDGDRIVPGPRTPLADRLLDQAAGSLVRETPYESVGDWLWRRGRDLESVYLAALETDGQLTRQRGRWLHLKTGRTTLADSPDRSMAEDRWTSHEPVLAALATAVGLGDEDTPTEDARSETEDAPSGADDAKKETEAAGEKPEAAGEKAEAAGEQRGAAGEKPEAAEEQPEAEASETDDAVSETDDGVSGARDSVEEVLAEVNDALLELETVRQRRDVEQAAFDNIWRGDW